MKKRAIFCLVVGSLFLVAGFLVTVSLKNLKSTYSWNEVLKPSVAYIKLPATANVLYNHLKLIVIYINYLFYLKKHCLRLVVCSDHDG